MARRHIKSLRISWTTACLALWCVGEVFALNELGHLSSDHFILGAAMWFFPSFVALLTLICVWHTRRFIAWHLSVMVLFASSEFYLVVFTQRGEQRGMQKMLTCVPSLFFLIVLAVLWLLSRKSNRDSRGVLVKSDQQRKGVGKS